MRQEDLLVVLLLAVLGFFIIANIQIPEKEPILYDKPEEIIILPVKAHIVKDLETGDISGRTKEDIEMRFGLANEIWKQAGLYLNLTDVVVTETNYPIRYNIVNSENFDKEQINLLFVKDLGGSNGYALPNYKIVFVSDNTTVNDYRTLAHEIGHLIGLSHHIDRSNLMFSGSNGSVLEEDQIITARSLAKRYMERGY